MKIEFQETNYEYGFTLRPETPNDFAQLLRIAKQSKREVPNIYTSFYNDNPYCAISMPRIESNKRVTSLTNQRGNK